MKFTRSSLAKQQFEKQMVDKIYQPNEHVLMPDTLQSLKSLNLDQNIKRDIKKKLSNGTVSSSKSTLCGTPSSKQSRQNNALNFLSLSAIVNSPKKLLEIQIKKEKKVNLTHIMLDRWQKSNFKLPQVDLQDIIDENLLVNSSKKTGPKHQNHPEYTQQSYLRLRKFEENFFTTSQFIPKQKQILNKKRSKSMNKTSIIKIRDRSNLKLLRQQGIQKLFELHQLKQYRIETLFVAANIFDRYLQDIDSSMLYEMNLVCIATTCILLAAKLEQPIAPSFEKMISLLAESEKKEITRQKIIDMEAKILVTLGFDFNFPGPIQSVERYLRILNYDLNNQVYRLACSICKFQLNEDKFLKYRPSMIAACASILGINIFEKDQLQKVKSDFFSELMLPQGKMKLNLDIWNNHNVHNLTGYSIEDIKNCLLELCNFMIEDLLPNRLAPFEISYIKETKIYQGELPSNIVQSYLSQQNQIRDQQ